MTTDLHAAYDPAGDDVLVFAREPGGRWQLANAPQVPDRLRADLEARIAAYTPARSTPLSVATGAEILAEVQNDAPAQMPWPPGQLDRLRTRLADAVHRRKIG